MIENKAQSIAISHYQGPMLVLAGPGSGKTHVITKRISYLIEEYNVRPEEILVITFTKYAANEMKERYRKSKNHQKAVTFGTFHGIFYGILKWAYNIGANNILSEEEKGHLIRDIIINSNEIEESFDIQIEDEKEFIDNISKEISMVKGEGIPLNTYEAKECSNVIFQQIYGLYETNRKKLRKIDFDDMIAQCYKLLSTNGEVLSKWQEKFRYILIDEFQDINQMQFNTIKLLAESGNHLFIVGDDDQSIYGFRGAKPEIMLRFTEFYPSAKKVVLETNYRSTDAIIKASLKVIKTNVNRYEKLLETNNLGGSPVHVQEVKDPIEESEYILNEIQKLQKCGIANEKIAILFRTNLDARTMAGKLIEYGIPFHMKESIPNIYEHFIAKNIISYMHLAMGKRERNHFLQVMNRPNRYIGRDAIDQGEVNFQNICAFYSDKEWMQDRIEQLMLDLRIMKTMTPYAMIQYLRKRVGYEEFLKEYAKYRKLNYQDLIETLEEIQSATKNHQTYEDWLEYIEQYGMELKKQINGKQRPVNAISLHTMHGAKGLEYEYVYIIECNEGVSPSKKALLPEEIEEERRMFYVAMTRAKTKLTMVYVKQKNGKDMNPSRFVDEIFEN